MLPCDIFTSAGSPMSLQPPFLLFKPHMTVSSVDKFALHTSAQTKPSEPASLENKCHMPSPMPNIVLAITGGYYQTLSTKVGTLLGLWSSFISTILNIYFKVNYHFSSDLNKSKNSLLWIKIIQRN